MNGLRGVLGKLSLLKEEMLHIFTLGKFKFF